MSKVDAQRAMREARYAAQQSPAASSRRGAQTAPTVAARTPATSAARRPGRAHAEAPDVMPATQTPATQTPATEVPAESEATCGHRNMGNKRCQRPARHPEKNHRYT